MSLLLALLLQPAQAATLVLQIDGVLSTQGQLLIVVFRGAEGFPSKPEAAFRAGQAVPVAPLTTVEFHDLPAGEYAVSVVHDENANNALDVGRFIPIPTEPLGSSRDAKARMGPPKYEDAVFAVAAEGRHVERFTLKDF